MWLTDKIIFMKKILHHIRNKPDHVRTRYVIGFSVLATAVIVFIWIATLRLLKTSDDTIKTESPFRSMINMFSGTVSKVQDDYQKQQDEMDASLNKNIGTEPVTTDETAIDPATDTTPTVSDPMQLDARLNAPEIPVKPEPTQ
jgi:hypothetical protein